MKEIIELAGKPKSGKSEVAKYLCSKYGIDNFVEMSDQIVVEVEKAAEAIGVKYDPQRKGDFRLLIQWVAHYRRLQNPDYWLKPIIEAKAPVVIGGVRYVNEIEEIRKKGGVVWKINRLAAENNDTAPTEIQLIDFNFDAEIENNGTLDDLYKKVDNLLTQ